MSWYPPELLKMTDVEQQALIDEMTEAYFAFDCEEKKTCSNSDKMKLVKAILLMSLTWFKDDNRSDFVDRFLGKMADICTGNLVKEGTNPSKEYFETEWYKYVSTHAEEFCVPSKYSDMLYNEKLPILDVMMMLPFKYMDAFGL